MHKIKEMLHKDDDSNTSNTDSKDLKHSHSHTHTREGENIEKGQLSTKEFKHDHVRHGEIEHGTGASTTHVHTHTHDHGHQHHGDRDLKMSGGEKHIYHEREIVHGGDLYRDGADPTLNREIEAECRHDEGTSRARVAESKIVKEKIKEVELHKVQPVIHREREQKEIRHVVEPHQKFEVKDTKVLHKEKDIDLGTRREASTLETSRGMEAPVIEASREHIGTERQHQELPMRVEEHVHRKVEEHVHPVVYKETLKPKVTEETHHIYETVKEKPIETYEVKDLERSRGMGLAEAERSFFNEHSSRGIDVDLHKNCTHKHGDYADCKLDTRDRGLDTHSHSHTHTHTIARDNLATEPIVGHHQNIGAHHVAGAIPAGHNTAYDAALCNECTGNQICSHGERDAALMQKMNEKKITKDKNLEKKEEKKLKKSGDSKTKTHTVV